MLQAVVVGSLLTNHPNLKEKLMENATQTPLVVFWALFKALTAVVQFSLDGPLTSLFNTFSHPKKIHLYGGRFTLVLNVEIGLDQITSLILALFIGNTSSLPDLGQEYKWCPAGNTMGSTWLGIACITKAVSWWQVSRTSVQLGDPNGNDGTWTMTETKCAAIKRLMSIMHSGDKTEFINRLKTSDLTNRNMRIFSRRDQIQIPMDEVLTEEAASQQQTLTLAEGPLQDMTITCK